MWLFVFVVQNNLSERAHYLGLNHARQQPKKYLPISRSGFLFIFATVKACWTVIKQKAFATKRPPQRFKPPGMRWPYFFVASQVRPAENEPVSIREKIKL